MRPDPNVRPVKNMSNPINVRVGLSLNGINSFDTENNILVIPAWLEMVS